VEVEGDVFLVSRLNAKDIKASTDINWKTYKDKAMDYLDVLFSNGDYGNVTSLGLYNTAGEMMLRISTYVPEQESPEVKASIKAIPSTVVVPLDDGSFVRLRIQASTHLPFKHHKEIPQGVDVMTNDEFCTKVGPLCHIPRNNDIFAISAAHVLTYYNDKMIGKEVGKFTRGEPLDTSFDYHVSGHMHVDLYPSTQVIRNPKKNLYDFAWCKLPPGANRECLKIPEVCAQVGASRDPVEGEKVIMWCRAVDALQGVVVDTNSKRAFSVRGSEVNYMSFGFEVDFGQESTVIYDGLSGAVVVSASDLALLGTLTGEGEGDFRYFSRIPTDVEW